MQINARAAVDPFAPYLKSIPTVKQIISEENSGTGSSAITTRKFIFNSRNNTNALYAIMAFPQQQGVYPAMLILHGGGGNAQGLTHLVEEYAARGYVAVCFDMPGICNNGTTPNSSGAWKLRKGPLEVPRFDIASGLENSTLFDAGVSGLEMFNYIASQKNVDAKNIGITGFSWGGYATTFLSGILGKRVKAAYAVFGCGFYEKATFWVKIIADLPDSVRTPWLKYFDAGRRAPGIKAPYFLEATSNDTYFWPESVTATLDVIPGTKNHVWDTNFNHKQQPAGPTMQKLYFDYYLKGVGQPFGTAKITNEKLAADSSKQITIKVDEPKGVTASSVVLYYSVPTDKWQTRVWVPINATADGSNYTATIPADLVKKGVNYYAYVTDDRTVAVASNMYNALYNFKHQPAN
ncbi:MAG TPA: alpha/beta fold hydrolase [Mucilaginibacter sp.]|nr:alpha/beta fold hydrolase [Mucilaginibacter sp.]